MPRTLRPAARPARGRALLRALVTTATSVLLLVMTALPALAASAGTKPTADGNPYLIGSLEQLGTASIVGLVIAIIVWVMMEPEAETADDEHH